MMTVARHPHCDTKIHAGGFRSTLSRARLVASMPRTGGKELPVR